jgi:hypothetical protein
LPQLLVSRVILVELHTALTQRGDLARFQIGLREDFAVHFDENLLDDFGGQPCW